MRDPVAFLLFVSLLAIVFLKGNQGIDWEEEITKSFAEFDKNQDGNIDEDEFRIVYTLIYSNYAFNKYDVDGDRKLNLGEYTKEWLDFDDALWKDSDIYQAGYSPLPRK